MAAGRTWVFLKDGLTVEVDAGVDNRVDGRQEPVGGGALAVVGPEMRSCHEFIRLRFHYTIATMSISVFLILEVLKA